MTCFSLSYIYNLYNLNRIQKLSISKLRYVQDLKLRNLVKHAYYNVDYYRELFDQAGITPENIKEVRDISKIPISTRESFQKCALIKKLYKGNNIYKCIRYSTSGTTGQPLAIYLSKDEEIAQGMLYLRMLFANGYKINHKLAIVTNPQFIKRKYRKNFYQRLGFLNKEYLSIFSEPGENLKRLMEIKPDIIMGYTPVIKAIASKIREENLKIKPYLVLCTADFLSREDRSLISDAFGAEVIDYYSSSECGLIAWECREHTGYHINIDCVIVELIINGRESMIGEKGELIITNLDTHTMPFIRYKTNDFAVLTETPCLCGSTLPMIKNIFKRQQSKQCSTLSKTSIQEKFV